MKKLIIILLLSCISVFASENKNYNPGEPQTVTGEQTQTIKPDQPTDTCTKYKVFTKKVITSSTRGELVNTGWMLKNEFTSCGNVNTSETRVGYDIKYIKQAGNTEEGITTEEYVKNECQDCELCKASKNVTEVKASFALFEDIIKEITDVVNKTPRVELKCSVKPNLTVKKGEECCDKNKPPVKYTELKGGVEVGAELRITLFGLPDVNEKVKLWPYLLKLEMRNKIYCGPYGKANIEGVGKFYGELGDNTPHPGCATCFYSNFKYEGGVKLGIILGGSVKLYRWSFKKGFDDSGEPEGEIKAEAEAAVSLGVEINATYGTQECSDPQPGLHGKITIGKAKALLRLEIKLGPLSFTPKYEYQLFDGFSFGW